MFLGFTSPLQLAMAVKLHFFFMSTRADTQKKLTYTGVDTKGKITQRRIFFSLVSRKHSRATLLCTSMTLPAPLSTTTPPSSVAQSIGAPHPPRALSVSLSLSLSLSLFLLLFFSFFSLLLLSKGSLLDSSRRGNGGR